MIIRWICEKDRKKWIYPVEKCIYCKGPVKKIISREAKIIGMTKVNVPSPLHPIVPYNVVLLQDEHGNRMPKKTMKDYKIGDTYSIKKPKSKNAVIVTKIKYDLREALKESLELIGYSGLKEGDKVLIKPSIIEPAYHYQAVDTSPKLMDALLGILKEKGITDVVVAEQSWPGNGTIASAEKAGITEACNKYGCKILDLKNSEYTEKETDGMKFNIGNEVFERKVINVPVLKTNSQILVSGAMENMIRVTDSKTQEMMYSNDIEKTLPKLIKALPEFLTIGDGTIGMHAQGPTSLGDPAFLNMLLISNDAVALDAVFAEIGMLPKPEYVKEADSIGAGEGIVKNIEVVGEDLEAVKLNLKPASKEATGHPRIKLIDGKSSPAIFNEALGVSSKLIGLSGYQMHLAIGKFIEKGMTAEKERIVAYGKDAIEKMRELGVKTAAEIPEDMESMEKIVLIKSILEDQKKETINAADRIKSKIASFGMKLKKNFSK
ncbi:DUF362 domain-containing protein [Candidatus Woesearchaeota archaeon]|nr:DUF362 domain-containing protein [Candidatus Woesearchaeota archaeon]